MHFPLQMTPSADNTHTQSLVSFIESTFPGSILKDIHQGVLMYHIPLSVTSWSRVFGVMETARHQFCVEDYSVCQTTLEQVFINFARSYQADDGKTPDRKSFVRYLNFTNCYKYLKNRWDSKEREYILLDDGDATFDISCDNNVDGNCAMVV